MKGKEKEINFRGNISSSAAALRASTLRTPQARRRLGVSGQSFLISN